MVLMASVEKPTASVLASADVKRRRLDREAIKASCQKHAVSELQVGSKVRIDGLKSASELNGSVGHVRIFCNEHKRWIVTLLSGVEKLVKAENLTLIRTAEPPKPVVSAEELKAKMHKAEEDKK